MTRRNPRMRLERWALGAGRWALGAGRWALGRSQAANMSGPSLSVTNPQQLDPVVPPAFGFPRRLRIGVSQGPPADEQDIVDPPCGPDHALGPGAQRQGALGPGLEREGLGVGRAPGLGRATVRVGE